MRDFCRGETLANTVVSLAASCSSWSDIFSISSPRSMGSGLTPTSMQIFRVTTGLSPVRTLMLTPWCRSSLIAWFADSLGGSRKVRSPFAIKFISSSFL